MVSYLLQLGADVNVPDADGTPLMIASRIGMSRPYA